MKKNLYKISFYSIYNVYSIYIKNIKLGPLKMPESGSDQTGSRFDKLGTSNRKWDARVCEISQVMILPTVSAVSLIPQTF
jgi:hypothetical protein